MSYLLSPTITSAKFGFDNSERGNDRLLSEHVAAFAPNLLDLQVSGTATCGEQSFKEFYSSLFANCSSLVSLKSDVDCLESIDKLSSTGLKVWNLGGGTMSCLTKDFADLAEALGSEPKGFDSLKALQSLKVRVPEQEINREEEGVKAFI